MNIQQLIKLLLMMNPRASSNLTQRLADSRPIRAAARVVAQMYLQSKKQIENKVTAKMQDPKIVNPTNSSRANHFFQNFINNLKKEIKEEERRRMGR